MKALWEQRLCSLCTPFLKKSARKGQINFLSKYGKLLFKDALKSASLSFLLFFLLLTVIFRHFLDDTIQSLQHKSLCVVKVEVETLSAVESFFSSLTSLSLT